MDFDNIIFFLVIAIPALLIGGFTLDEISWSKIESKSVKCDLISKNYKGSTLETHAVPTMNSNGSMGVGVVTTGDSEEYISTFQCEDVGSIVSNDKKIFTKAKEHNILLIKIRNDDYRVKGIL